MQQCSFTQLDITPFAEALLVALFTTIERGQTPQDIAKNDVLMRCASASMRHGNMLTRGDRRHESDPDCATSDNTDL